MKKLISLTALLAVSLFALTSCNDNNGPEGPETGGETSGYKVGDPYVVNGQTVGIVYEVNADGTHGKAFSLSVYNDADNLFYYEESYGVDKSYGAWIDNPPLSTTDGLANAQTMKQTSSWQMYFLALKWVEDLGEAQGVEWYIPAIEELKTLVEYMSDAKFTTVTIELPSSDGQSSTHTLDEAISSADAAKIDARREVIREMYKTYTAGNSFFTEEQYVVFEPYTSDDSGAVTDEGDHRHLVENTYYDSGDNYAYRWMSSTVIDGARDQFLQIVSMRDDITNYPFPTVGSIGAINFEEDFGTHVASIHPICQF